MVHDAVQHPESRGATNPRPISGAHDILRRGTRVWHEAVEAAFAPFNLGQAPGLRGFLLAQAAAVLPLEAELDRQNIADILPDWSRRRRAASLVDDLAELGAKPSQPDDAPDLSSTAHQLGAVYVLEGSRLGGRILARQVGCADGSDRPLPTSFLRHSAGPGAWAAFLAVLALHDHDPSELLAGADAAFRLFHRAASWQASTL